MKGAKLLMVALVLVAALLLMGVAAASGNAPQPLLDLYSRLTGQTAAEAVDEPISVRHGDAMLTLERAMASGSQTVVEFVLESTELPDDLESMYHYTVAPSLLPADNIRIEGFEEDTVLNRSETRMPGKFQIVLELPAPTTFDAPVVIEFGELELSPFNSDVEPQPLGGPWRFEFVPEVPEAQREQSEVALDIEGGNDDVQIAVDQLQRSATETVITYRLLPPTHPNMQPMGVETLLLGDERFEARGKDGNTTLDEIEARSHTISFPALPADAARFTLEFGPFWVPQGVPTELTLDIEKLRADGQDVTVEGYELHFWLEPSKEMHASEELYYRPTDGESIPFTLSAPTADIQIEDDLGQSYSVTGGTTEHDPDSRHLKQQMYRIVEPLQEGASSLTFRTSITGKIVDPIQIPVTVPSR